MRANLSQMLFAIVVVAAVFATGSPTAGEDRPPAIKPAATEPAATEPAAINPAATEPAVAKPRLLVQLGHALAVTSVAISPDGKQLLTGGNDHTALLWDVDSGKDLRSFEGHTGPVAFSPDGKQILTGANGTLVRVLDAASGLEIHQLKGHTNSVNSAVFSPDGTEIVTGSSDGTARLWSAVSGKEIRRFQGYGGPVNSVAISPNGTQILTGAFNNQALLWDAATGKDIQRFNGHSQQINAVAFSPDGKQIVTGSDDHSARLWDAASGNEVQRFLGHTEAVVSVAFAPDGQKVLTRSRDGTTRLWDAATGKEIRRFGNGGPFGSATFSRDGTWVATGGFGAQLWNSASGKLLRTFRGLFSTIESVAFSPDGAHVLTGGRDGTRLWDLRLGKEIGRFEGRPTFVQAVAFSRDGSQVLLGCLDGTARLLDMASGKEIRRINAPRGSVVESVAFSPDGKLALAAVANFSKQDQAAILWDVLSGKEIRRFTGHLKPIHSAVFSPDGAQVLTASSDDTARLWDVASGKEIRRFAPHSFGIYSASFSPDGAQVLTGSIDGTARLWDAASGVEVRRFGGRTARLTSVAFSPNGKQLLAGSDDNTARLWDAGGGKEIWRFQGHSGPITSVGFSPDGTKALTGSKDCTSRIWNVATGEQLCALIGSPHGEWAVVDPDGRFDGSNGGAVDGLHWVVGKEPIELSQLKERYYDPGLLAKRLGFNHEPLREVAAFTTPKLYPGVAIVPPQQGTTHFDIHLANRGGGIGRVVVRINGKELTADARGARADPNAATITIPVNLAGDPRLKPGQKNVVEVEAFNAEGYLRTRGLELEVDDPRAASSDEKPNLWALVVGVSRYQGGAINLRYAAKDAKDFAGALRIAAVRLFGADNFHLTLLTSEENVATDAAAPGKPDRSAPDHKNILAALEALQDSNRVKPSDILVVYLAGHGVTRGGADEGFYYLTCDAQSAEINDPAVRQQWAISDQELTAAIAKSPALKQVMILDTCHSGKLIEDMTAKRDVPTGEVRVLERIKDRTGLHILAGCASDSGSYEASRYGQGVLTYSLLLGMRGAALKEDQFVDVATLFDFAADRVPALAKNLGGIQRPVISSPKGSSFEIGEVTADDRKRIPLQRERPLVLRSAFQDEQSFDDVLELAKKVDEQLRGVEVRGAQAGIVFVDARELPDSYRVAGRYQIDGEKVTVSVNMFQDKKRIRQFTITGKTTAVDDLAGQIVAETEKQLGSPNP